MVDVVNVDRCPVTGKVSYSKIGSANKALTNCRRIGRPEIRVYRCRDCRRFHLTSKRESER